MTPRRPRSGLGDPSQGPPAGAGRPQPRCPQGLRPHRCSSALVPGDDTESVLTPDPRAGPLHAWHRDQSPCQALCCTRQGRAQGPRGCGVDRWAHRAVQGRHTCPLAHIAPSAAQQITRACPPSSRDEAWPWTGPLKAAGADGQMRVDGQARVSAARLPLLPRPLPCLWVWTRTTVRQRRPLLGSSHQQPRVGTCKRTWRQDRETG